MPQVGLFDLKGSTLDRRTGKQSVTLASLDADTVYKDVDFAEALGEIELYEAERLISTLK